MASLTKRPRNKNKPWSVQWYDGAGKRREAAFRTNREAKDFKIKLEHDQREGTFVDPGLGREPFGDAARRWLGDQMDRNAIQPRPDQPASRIEAHPAPESD